MDNDYRQDLSPASGSGADQPGTADSADGPPQPERKPAQEAILQSEQRLRGIFENAGVGILEADGQDRFIAANDRACQILGCPAEDLLGKTVHDLTAPEDRDRSNELNAQLHEGRFPRFETEKRYLRSDGAAIWLHVTVSAIRDAAGRYIGGIATLEDVSERKRAEEEVRISEARYRALVELSPDGIFVNRNDRIELINQAALDMFRATSAEELLGKSPLFLFHPNYHQLVAERIKTVLTGRSVPLIEEKFVRLDGTTGIAEVAASPFTDHQGTAIQVFIRDITDRKRVEDALRVSEEQLKHAARVAGLGIFVHDHVTDRIQWSSDLKQICGWDPSFEPGLGDWVECVHPDDRARISEAIRRAHDPRGEGLYFVEHRIIRPDGKLRWVSVRSQTFFEGEGAARHPLRTIGATLDITMRKRAEQAVAQSEERLRFALEGANDGIWDVNMNTGDLFSSPRDCEMLGYRHDEMPRTVSFWYELVHPEDLPLTKERLADYLAGRTPLFEVEQRLRMKTGQWKWVLARGKIVERDEAGNPVRMTGTHTDITERKRAEDALRQTVQELERSNWDLEQFAYVASHDLQEPLRMVTSYMDLLQCRYADELDKDAREFIAFAAEGAGRMQQLIRGLLDYSRVGSRGRTFQQTDAQAAFDGAVADLDSLIKQSAAEITHDPLPQVWADPTQLSQVLQNLIGNAIKFRSDRPPRIHVGARCEHDRWEFSVRDNGIGIEPRNFERIFQVFQRLHTREEYPGSGIGLAICKKIVERHGGKIWVQSQPGGGSTFHFTIPKRNLSDESAQQRLSDPPHSAGGR